VRVVVREDERMDERGCVLAGAGFLRATENECTVWFISQV
jgi:hypothetical protein